MYVWLVLILCVFMGIWCLKNKRGGEKDGK